jgi:hypothetical protein
LQDKWKRTAQQILSNTFLICRTNEKEQRSKYYQILWYRQIWNTGNLLVAQCTSWIKAYNLVQGVALVLDWRTALISPQFHISFDPSFHTIKQDKFDSQWQLKAGFIAQRELKTPITTEMTVNANKRQNDVQWVLPPEGVTSPISKWQRTKENDQV